MPKSKNTRQTRKTASKKASGTPAAKKKATAAKSPKASTAKRPTKQAAGNGQPVKLGKGELRAQALTFINEHAERDHSPYRVAQALGGRSAGAVGLALERLVALGEARQTSETPRRYQASRVTSAAKRPNK